MDYSKYSRVVCWVSCGAPSAVAAKVASTQFKGTHEVVFCYQDAGAEHEDNKRFLKDLGKWLGKEVLVQKSDKHEDIYDVFKKRRFLVGPGGAPCTGELKRKVAEEFLNWGKDLEIFGYTADEQVRVDRFMKNNPERNICNILIEKGLTKADCKAILINKGIELPAMYKLGYKNNNCIGCVKGQAGYWNKIRVDFPEVFKRMAELERDIGAAINKRYRKALPHEMNLQKPNGKPLVDKRGNIRERVFLDELEPTAGRYRDEESIQCGIMCIQADEYL